MQESKVHGANMGPTWVLSAPDGPMLAPWTLLSGMSSIHLFVAFLARLLHQAAYEIIYKIISAYIIYPDGPTLAQWTLLSGMSSIHLFVAFLARLLHQAAYEIIYKIISAYIIYIASLASLKQSYNYLLPMDHS